MKKRHSVALSLRMFVSLRGPRSGPKQSNFLRDKSGVSLIIAVVFVSFFMLVTAGMFEVFLRTIDSISNRETKVKADMLAASAKEIASYWAATAEVGQNFEDLSQDAQNVFLQPLYEMADELGVANCAPAPTAGGGRTEPCVSIEVKGRNTNEVASKVAFAGATSADYFSAPMKGTGNASTVCVGNLNDADNACNWNKITVGESVEIPLYYVDAASGQPVKLFVDASDEFRLRVRTPVCSEIGIAENDATCPSEGSEKPARAILYPDPRTDHITEGDYGKPSKDPVLIQWTISDLSSAGTSTLLANEAVEGEVRRMNLRPSLNIQNTEISAGRINLAKNGIFLGTGNPKYDFLDQNIVLNYFNGADGSKLQGIALDRKVVPISDFVANVNIINPVLRLALIDRPQIPGCKAGTGISNCVQDVNNSKYNVPYLEYQLLVKGTPIPDSKSVVKIKVKVGDFNKEKTVSVEHKATLGGFALENL